MGIVRFFEVDIDDSLRVDRALMRIKGVSFSFAHAVIQALGIPRTKTFADLTEEEREKLEDAIRNPLKYGIPEYLLNRRRDFWTNESKHVVASELDMTVRDDIRRLRKIRAYRGIRHELGLPVRGQRTRSRFRKNKKSKLKKKK